jgi:hypothetical protein
MPDGVNIIVEMKNKAGHNTNMKNQSLDFEELIALLGKVKSPADVTNEMIDEMIGAALAMLVIKSGTEGETSRVDKIKIARLHVMDYFDGLLLDAILERESE